MLVMSRGAGREDFRTGARAACDGLCLTDVRSPGPDFNRVQQSHRVQSSRKIGLLPTWTIAIVSTTNAHVPLGGAKGGQQQQPKTPASTLAGHRRHLKLLREPPSDLVGSGRRGARADAEVLRRTRGREAGAEVLMGTRMGMGMGVERLYAEGGSQVVAFWCMLNACKGQASGHQKP